MPLSQVNYWWFLVAGEMNCISPAIFWFISIQIVKIVGIAVHGVHTVKKWGENFAAQNPPVGAFQNKNPPQIFGQQFVNKPPVINGHEQIRTDTTIRAQTAKVLIFQYEQTPTYTNRQGDLWTTDQKAGGSNPSRRAKKLVKSLDFTSFFYFLPRLCSPANGAAAQLSDQDPFCRRIPWPLPLLAVMENMIFMPAWIRKTTGFSAAKEITR